MRYIYSEERLPIPENGEQAIRPLLFEVIGRKDVGAEWETSSGAFGCAGRMSAPVWLQELFARKTAATSLSKRRRCENDCCLGSMS
jgi:hypothetical protein